MRDVILTERGPKPIGPYSQAVRTNGFLYVSGQVALDPKTGEMTGADIRQQTQRVLLFVGRIQRNKIPLIATGHDAVLTQHNRHAVRRL